MSENRPDRHGTSGPRSVAWQLLADRGPPGAWQHATSEAIDAHLRRDEDAARHWRAVLQELRAVAPRPGESDLDVYRSARNLVACNGAHEAWRHAIQRGVEAEGDVPQQAYWSRVADVVNALARGFGKDGA